MKIKCDECKGRGKGKYSTFFFGNKLVTLCDDCRWGKGIRGGGDKDKKTWEHISTPFWVHMGLEPKTAAEKKQVAHLKKYNMSWGDLRKERDAKLARSEGGWNKYMEYKKNGGKVEPIPFKKES